MEKDIDKLMDNITELAQEIFCDKADDEQYVVISLQNHEPIRQCWIDVWKLDKPLEIYTDTLAEGSTMSLALAHLYHHLLIRKECIIEQQLEKMEAELELNKQKMNQFQSASM